MTATVSVARTIAGVGVLEFEESDKRRAYWLRQEGNSRRTRLPSVTTILRETWAKPRLLAWYAEQGTNAPAVLQAASERGKAVHLFVETFMRDGTLLPFEQFPVEYRGYLQGVARFLWERDPKPIAVERLVCHPEMNYAGRLDLIAEVDGARTLLDYKSNPKGAVYPEAHVQAIAYAIADERCGSAPIERVMLVGISEDGRCLPVAGEMDVTRKVWASALDYYRQIQRLKRAMTNGGPS